MWGWKELRHLRLVSETQNAQAVLIANSSSSHVKTTLGLGVAPFSMAESTIEEFGSNGRIIVMTELIWKFLKKIEKAGHGELQNSTLYNR